MRYRAVLPLIAFAIFTIPVRSQDAGANSQAPGGAMPDMPGMNMQSTGQRQISLIESLQTHATSGTDAEPGSTLLEMMMKARGKWALMFHGEAFLNDIQ